MNHEFLAFVCLHTSGPSLRFSPSTCKSLKAHVMQLVTEQLGRHAPPSDSVSRNLLRFLTSAAGLHEVRLLVAQKIEAWIQNPKVSNMGGVWYSTPPLSG